MGGDPRDVPSRVGGRGRHRAPRRHGVAVRTRREVRAVPDLQQRTLALRTAPRSRRSRLPSHVRRPYARSKDAAVTGTLGVEVARTQLRAGVLLADERDEALVVFGARRTVVQVLGDVGEQLADVPPFELALHVLGKKRSGLPRNRRPARSAEQPRQLIAFAHHVSSRSRCPSRSRRRRSFSRASWSTL